jgi:trigger factor
MNLRRNAATIIPAEHAAEEGDLVYFNLSGEFKDLPEDEDATITDKTPQQVVVPAKGEKSKTEWPFPGFAAKLLGVSAGDKKTIQKTYPKNYHDEDFRGKKAVFTVDVQSVKELELPELDEEFVKTMGDYESPEAFKTSIEEKMRQDEQEKYDEEYFNGILDAIAEKTTMVYPPQMLEHEQEHVLEDIKSRLSNQNLDFETYLKLRETDEEKFMEEEVVPVAKQRLERNLLVDALIAAEEIKLDESMLQDQINQVMTELFYSGNAQQMQKEMGKEEFSRAISMEGVQRTIGAQLQNRLKLIATGQPIPEDVEPEDEAETVEEEEADEEAAAEEMVEEATSEDDESAADEADKAQEAEEDEEAE